MRVRASIRIKTVPIESHGQEAKVDWDADPLDDIRTLTD